VTGGCYSCAALVELSSKELGSVKGKTRRITMRKLGLYFAAASIVFSVLLAFRQGQHVRADNGSLVGTWIVTVTVNTPPGAPPFVFTDLISFNSGGTLTATSTAFNAHTSENPFSRRPSSWTQATGTASGNRSAKSQTSSLRHFRGSFLPVPTLPWNFTGRFSPDKT